MDELASVQSENENLRKIRARLMQWEAKNDALAGLNSKQEEFVEIIANIWKDDVVI